MVRLICGSYCVRKSQSQLREGGTGRVIEGAGWAAAHMHRRCEVPTSGRSARSAMQRICSWWLNLHGACAAQPAVSTFKYGSSPGARGTRSPVSSSGARGNDDPVQFNPKPSALKQV
eukprot:363265-Chlamydomonas_euryale.AAC.9